MDFTNFPAAYWFISCGSKELFVVAVAGNRFIV
jgi:uncharacterized membrane protein